MYVNCFPTGYPKHIPPTKINGQGKLEVNLVCTVERVIDVVDTKHYIEVEYKEILIWKDNRLRYRNLQTNLEVNKLSFDDFLSIWKPKMFLENSIGGNGKTLENNLFVNQTGEKLMVDLNDYRMGKYKMIPYDK